MGPPTCSFPGYHVPPCMSADASLAWGPPAILLHLHGHPCLRCTKTAQHQGTSTGLDAVHEYYYLS